MYIAVEVCFVFLEIKDEKRGISQSLKLFTIDIQYNLVKPPPSAQPDFGDKLSKDRKPEVNSLILNLK